MLPGTLANCYGIPIAVFRWNCSTIWDLVHNNHLTLIQLVILFSYRIRITLL